MNNRRTWATLVTDICVRRKSTGLTGVDMIDMRWGRGRLAREEGMAVLRGRDARTPSAWLALITCALVLAAGCSRDSDAPKPDRTLEYAREELPAEQNAYPIWTNVFAQIKEPEMSHKQKQVFRDVSLFKTNVSMDEVGAQLAEWLDSKREALALIDRALEMRLQFPVQEIHGTNLMYWSLQGFMDVANLKLVSGRLFAERGAYDDAACEYLDVVRLGQCVVADGDTIYYITGRGLQEKGLSAIRRFCMDERVPAAVMRQTLERLPAQPSEDRDLAKMFGREHANILALFRESMSLPTLRKQSIGDWMFKIAVDVQATETLLGELCGLNQTNAVGASWAEYDRRLFMKYGKQDRKEAHGDLIGKESLGRKFRSLKTVFWYPNFVGERWVSMSADGANTALRRSFQTRTLLGLTRAFVALRVLRLETGAYPASLDEVVAKGILPEVPVDFFDGQPLRYSAERRLLWSVGEDCADDGGAEKTDVVITLQE